MMKRKTPLVMAMMAASGLVFAAPAGAVSETEEAASRAALYLAQAAQDQPLTDEEAQTQPPAAADEQAPGAMTPDEQTGAAMDTTGAILRTSDLIGKEVRNAEGEGIGEIHDIVLNKDGSVAYAVLAYGGILNIGSKLFAVPWDQVRLGDDKKHVVLNVSKERLDQLEGFDRNNWPAEPDFAAFEPEPAGGAGMEQPEMTPEGMEPAPEGGVMEPEQPR